MNVISEKEHASPNNEFTLRPADADLGPPEEFRGSGVRRIHSTGYVAEPPGLTALSRLNVVNTQTLAETSARLKKE